MIDVIFLQASQPNPIMSWLPLILIFGVLYFFMIRPQAKKQKAQTRFLTAVQKGDEIVTSSGIVGRINKIEGNTITMQIDSKTFIKVLKGSISKEMTDSYQKELTKETT